MTTREGALPIRTPVRRSAFQALVVAAVLVVGLMIGIFVGRATAPSAAQGAKSEPAIVLSTAGLQDPAAQIHRRVMRGMNRILSHPVCQPCIERFKDH